MCEGCDRNNWNKERGISEFDEYQSFYEKLVLLKYMFPFNLKKEYFYINSFIHQIQLLQNIPFPFLLHLQLFPLRI